MADGFIQVPTDSIGKKVETEEYVRYDGAIVERQRFSVPAGATVDGDVLRQLLIEMRLQSTLLAQAFGVTDDLNQMRADIASTDRLL